MAPFTAGVSLGLSTAGGVIGAAGGAINFVASLIEKRWDNIENHKVQKTIEIALTGTFTANWLLNECITSMKEAGQYLETDKGKKEAADAFNLNVKNNGIKESINKGKKIAKNAYTIGTNVYNGYNGIKAANEIKSIVDFIQADWYALNGAKIGLATDAAAPGKSIPIINKEVIKAGTTSAKMISGSLHVVGIAFGIWGVVDASKQLKNEDEFAKEIRKAASSIEKEGNKIISIYDEIRCPDGYYASSVGAPCTTSKDIHYLQIFVSN